MTIGARGLNWGNYRNFEPENETTRTINTMFDSFSEVHSKKMCKFRFYLAKFITKYLFWFIWNKLIWISGDQK